MVKSTASNQKKANRSSSCNQETHFKTGLLMQSTFMKMYTFSTVSFANYFVCVSFKEQVGYATQAELFKHWQIIC